MFPEQDNGVERSMFSEAYGFSKVYHCFAPTFHLPPDMERSGSIKREEFTYLFSGKLRLLSQQEAEALLGVLDRYIQTQENMDPSFPGTGNVF